MENMQNLDVSSNICVEKLKVLNIQRSCVHDGPGIRTVIFFAGCNLRCIWCHNPESQSFQTDMNKCYSVPDIMQVIMRDKEYYLSTNGGVTLSGGEPLMQDPQSLLSLLRSLKQQNIHVAVETAGHVPWKNIEEIASYVDLFLFDLKMVGNEKLHIKYTRQNDKLIYSNIQKLVELKAKIQFRMVIVPKLTDMDSHIEATAGFLKSINHNYISLLKYHNIYEAKSERLGLPQESLEITNDQSVAAIKRTTQVFRSYNIQADCVELDSVKQTALFSSRIQDIQKDIRESDCHLCLESSTLKTRFYRKNGFKKPTHIHRAERLEYLLNNKKTIVYPNELIVGNFTAKRVGGNVWEEYYGISMVAIIHQINRQTPVAFKCSFKDKLDFYFNIFPFWVKHGLVRHVNKSLSGLLLLFSRFFELKVAFQNNHAAIAHFVANHKRILELGTIGIREEIKAKQKEEPDKNSDFYNAALIALKGLEDFAERYASELSRLSEIETNSKRQKELQEMEKICRHVPKNPACTYYQALQSMMFLQIALCTESFENAISFGRVDQILYPYYQRDFQAGLIDYKKARELLACFILKVDEVVIVNDGNTFLGVGKLFESLSTVQAVTFGGVDQDGKDATNDLTYMLLDICELQPRGVNMTARIHDDSPRQYLERLAEVYINGSPMPALFNDKIYIETLKKHYPGTSLQNARNYSIVGCVEPVASDDHFGNTDCANMNVTLPFLQALKGEEDDLWNYGVADQFEKILKKILNNKYTRFFIPLLESSFKIINGKTRFTTYNLPENMDELLKRYQERMNFLASSVLASHHVIEDALRENFTTPLASSMYKGCIKRGKDVYEGGTDYNSSGIQAIGITDVADSLFALEEVVFKKKLYRLGDVVKAIDNNFEGEYNQKIRQELQKVPKFGDDSSVESQSWVNRVLQVYVDALESVKACPRNGIYTAGYYALNVNVVYGTFTQALPSGRLKGVPLAHGVAPHYGMQMVDLVSSLNSVSGINFAEYAPNGTTVTSTVDSAMFNGNDGAGNLAGFISGYFKKGGMQFQPNGISREILLDAYKNPDKHKYLLVRIAGYCAYFNELTDELKIAIINRTCYS